MRHFLVMTAFAALAAVVFGAVAKDSNRERLMYGIKVFAEFMVIGLVLAWILYFIPF
jgi:undecaprenyl pyrophosphate phosphatase UppP